MGFDPVSLTIAGVSMAANAIAAKAGADSARAANMSATQLIGQSIDQAMADEKKTLEEQNASLDKGLADATASYQSAVGALDPYANAGKMALNSYQSAITPGGEYNATNTPQYAYEKSMLEKNLGGVLASQGKGRSLTSAANVYAPAYQSLQSDASNRYMGNLATLMNQGYGAAGQQSGIYQNLAGAQTNYGANKSNVAGQGGAIMQNYMLNSGQNLAGKQLTDANIAQKEAQGYAGAVTGGINMYNAYAPKTTAMPTNAPVDTNNTIVDYNEKNQYAYA